MPPLEQFTKTTFFNLQYMESSSTENHQSSYWNIRKTKFQQVSNPLIPTLILVAALLFCISFWQDLPDFDIHPYVGKGIAGLGITMLFGMVGFKSKWPIIISLIGLLVYLGMSVASIL